MIGMETRPAQRAQYSTPIEYYWAKAEPDEMVNHLLARRESFFRFVNGSALFQKILRLWSYYHNLYYDARGDMDIVTAGEDLEAQMISVNHLRSLIHLLVTYTTQSRPSWDVLAINSGHRALKQTRLGRGLLEYYMEVEKVEQKLRKVVEHAFVLTTGYIRTIWDENLGRTLSANPRMDEQGNTIGGQMYQDGDIYFDTPTIFDVVIDFTIREWDQNQWLLVRRPVNKWDLVEIYPEKREQILNAGPEFQRIHDLERVGQVYLASEINTDFIDYWEFYHIPTKAMPQGRLFCMVGDTWLRDGDWDNPLPVHRMVAAELLLTCFGYSPGLDMMGSQEALNMLFSTTVTNANNFGQQKVWLRTGNSINLADLDAGCTIVQSKDEPKPLNLLPAPANMAALIDMFKQQMELVSGINSVSRGQPEASLRSGDALAIVDAKAMQFASVAIANYYQLLSDTGTATLQLLQLHADSPRVAAIAGPNNRSALKVFSKEDIDQIDMVRVIPGHPIMRTIAGREHVAAKLMQANLVTKEEYFTVLTTGELQPLTRSVESQLDVIHEENERLLQELMDGELPQALVHDDHALHIREHTAILDSTELRMHPLIAAKVLAHVKQHIALAFSPVAQQLAIFLGYPPLPLLPGALPPPGGSPSVPGASGGPNAPPPPAPPGPIAGPGGPPPTSTRELKMQAMKPALANS